MRDEAEENLLRGCLLGEAAERGENNGHEGEVDKGQVVNGETLDEDAPHATEQVLPQLGVTLVEALAQRASGLESLGLATKPFGEDERSENAQGDVGRHPQLVAGTTTSDTVASRHRKEKLTEAVADVSGETGTNEPSELLLGGEGDKRLAHDENDGDREHRGREKDGVQVESCVEEAGETLSDGHLANILAPKAELQLDGGVDSSNCPPGTLLEVTAEVLRNGTKLESLVDVSGLPALTKQLCRGGHIFSKGTQGEVADFEESIATSNVARASAPGNTHGILDGLNDVNEKVQRLRERISSGSVVEQLRRAGQSDFGVSHEMRKKSAEPARFGNLVMVSMPWS